MQVRHRLRWEEVAALLLRGHTYQEIADHLSTKYGMSVTRNVIAGLKRDMKAQKLTAFPVAAQERDPIPSLEYYSYGEAPPSTRAIPRFNTHPEIEVDRVTFAGDFHTPYIDKQFVVNMVDQSLYYGSRTLVIPGDLIDGLRKHHPRKVAGVPLGEQYGYARELLDFLFQSFNEIHITQGNHDDWSRLEYEGEFDITDTAYLLGGEKYVGRLFVYDYDRITVISGGQKWVAPHMKNYAPNPFTIGNKLAQKFQAHMIIPHTHLTGKNMDQNNRYVILAIGGMFDESLFEYTNLKTTTGCVMSPGYCMVIDGSGYLRSKHPYFNEDNF